MVFLQRPLLLSTPFHGAQVSAGESYRHFRSHGLFTETPPSLHPISWRASIGWRVLSTFPISWSFYRDPSFSPPHFMARKYRLESPIDISALLVFLQRPLLLSTPFHGAQVSAGESYRHFRSL